MASRLTVAARAMARGAKLAARERLALTGAETGNTHLALRLDESLRYIDSVYRDYLDFAGLREQDLAGMSVLEVGPGDNVGVAIRMIAAGAAGVTALDRFDSKRDHDQQRRIYQALIDSLGSDERERVHDLVTLEPDIGFDSRRLRVITGVSVERAAELFPSESFDLIVSYVVLQSVPSPARAIRAMDSVLKPGGQMVHRVDLSDLGLMGAATHPLAFLTFPERAYRFMTRWSADPNRWRTTDYVAAFQALGYDTHAHVSQVIGRAPRADARLPLASGVDYGEDTVALLDGVRPRLARRFRALPDEELMPLGAVLTARKVAPFDESP
jgi:SAM-dependent methyltransferase